MIAKGGHGTEDPATPGGDGNGVGRLRWIVGFAGGVYLVWWFTVELLLPGSFNPLPGRLVVVALAGALLGASYAGGWIERHLSALFAAWACVLVAHYSYLVVGNGGASTWWVGAFVTFAAASMCLQTRREVAVFSVFSMGCAIAVAAFEGQLAHSIYVPGLATILLLANLTKRSQTIAHDATLDAERARSEGRRADEQRFQLAAIVESSGDAIVGTNLAGTMETWNKGAERLFGYSADEAVGRQLSLLVRDGRESVEPALMMRVARGEHVGAFETVCRRKDGSDVDVSVTISPIRDSGGAIAGASIIARDISAWKRAQAETQRAREHAETANRELETFSYSIAHDLRAPLRAIDGFSCLVLDDYGAALDPVGQNHLQRVRKAAQHMGRLIDSLLALSRVNSVSIHAERVDLGALARTTLQRLRESDPDRRVEVRVAEGMSASGDGALLGSVVENLLANAWKFTRARADANIEFGFVEQDGRGVYYVRDNGAGFDMAFAPKLFGVFQRLHLASEFEGTGVGLATVQRIVHRHGGSIWAEGKVDGGACFYFTLGETQPSPAWDVGGETLHDG